MLIWILHDLMQSRLYTSGRGGGGGGGGWIYELINETHFFHVSLRPKSRSRKALEKQYLFRGSLCFQNKTTSQKWIHLWEPGGGPWCFGGPTQLAYSVYMEDRLWFNEIMNEQTNEWINKLIIYIVLYCVLLYTQSTLQSCGGGGVSP